MVPSRMDNIVDISIPVDAEVAAALTDEHNRAVVGQLIGRIVRPKSEQGSMARFIAEIKAQSTLTDADIDAELAAFKAERLSTP